MEKKNISLIISSRDNLKYLKWAYNSLRTHESPEIEICVADDFSSDGTWDWCLTTMAKDPYFKALRNEGPTRAGIVVMVDKLIKDIATHPIVGIYHADMYCAPNAVTSILDYITPGTVVSLTRVEPPLHPQGFEKITADFGLEPETFKEAEFLEWYSSSYLSEYNSKISSRITEGVFAPWFIYKSDFLNTSGHDPLFAPQSKEDSDLFNRFHLKGFKFLQLWKSVVYHLTSRGSRFNPALTLIGQNSNEWTKQNLKSMRNFIRKWGHSVLHDSYMKPIIPPKYDIGIILQGGLPLLRVLEPWASCIYLEDSYDDIADLYIQEEQSNTLFPLKERIKHAKVSNITNGVLIHVKQSSFNQEDFNFIQHISTHLENLSRDSSNFNIKGKFEIGNLIIEINNLEILNCNYIFQT